MRRLRKKYFLGLSGIAVAILAIVRATNPSVMTVSQSEASSLQTTDTLQAESFQPSGQQEVFPRAGLDGAPLAMPSGQDSAAYHRIRGVYSFEHCFPDLQEVQIVAARKWGVRPVRNREAAEQRKDELVYVGSNPYFDIDKGMKRSIPYLVPRASILLQSIGRNFLDSLYVKGVPLHKIIVSSVLRTEEDVAILRRTNGNASEQSCHRFGTTFDICYNRYTTVSHPDGPSRRVVQNDTLKWVLSEVLRDLRHEGSCYVKHERKQGCFHITVR